MGSRPCLLGINKKEWDEAFLDVVSVLGTHFNFGLGEYYDMRISVLVGLVNRYEKQVKGR